MKKNILLILLLVFFFNQTKVLAYDNPVKDVLGIQTKSIDIPPTIDGPGIFLPGNPLYFLDKFKQNTELLFAFKSENKVKIYERVAGERLAEVRSEAIRKNKTGMGIALDELVKNISNATLELTDVKGLNTEKSAINLNDSIKEKREKLSQIEKQVDPEMQFKIKAAKHRLLEEKVKVEDLLPKDLFEKEKNEDLKELLNDNIKNASYSTMEIEKTIDAIGKTASGSSEKEMKAKKEQIQLMNKIITDIEKVQSKFDENTNSKTAPPKIVIPTVITGKN